MFVQAVQHSDENMLIRRVLVLYGTSKQDETDSRVSECKLHICRFSTSPPILQFEFDQLHIPAFRCEAMHPKAPHPASLSEMSGESEECLDVLGR